MNDKLFSMMVCLVMLIVLSACSSSAGAESPEMELNSEPSNMQANGSNSNDSQYNAVTPFPTDLGPPNLPITILEDGTAMRVLWTVSSYVISTQATWGEEEAQALLFKPLDINDTDIIFDNQACRGVSFQKETMPAMEYLSNTWNITPQDLGIEVQEVQVIHTNCSLPGFQEYMRLNDRRLIVPINGVFFFFEPAVSY